MQIGQLETRDLALRVAQDPDSRECDPTRVKRVLMVIWSSAYEAATTMVVVCVLLPECIWRDRGEAQSARIPS